MTRTELLSRIIETFSQQSEIRCLIAFGREAIGKTDGYSDIDLIILSDDLGKTQGNYKNILSDISPILGSYFLRLEETEVVEMILLKDVSPYNKIDLSISNDLSGKEAFKPFKELYRRKEKGKNTQTKIRKDIGLDEDINNLHDRLFSIPRFSKTLYRGDQYEAYRRWQSTINEYLKIIMEETLGYVPEKLLNPVDFKKLAAGLNEKDKSEMDIILPSGKNFSIAMSYKYAMNKIIEYHYDRITKYPYPEFLDTMVKFLNEEVENLISMGERMYEEGGE